MFSRAPHYPLDLANELFQITEDMKLQGMCRAALLNRTQVHTFHKDYSEDHSSLPPTLQREIELHTEVSLIIDHMVIHFSCLYRSKILNIKQYLQNEYKDGCYIMFYCFLFCAVCKREQKKREHVCMQACRPSGYTCT